MNWLFLDAANSRWVYENHIFETLAKYTIIQSIKILETVN